MVADHPVHAGDDAGRGTGARAAEDAHRDQADALGDAVRVAADGAGDVRAVAVAVGGSAAVTDRVVARQHAAGELRVRGQNARIDDVGGHARAGLRVGVEAVEREQALVDAVEAPRRAALGGVDADHAVGLDAHDGRVLRQPRHLRGGQLGGVAVDRVGVQGERRRARSGGEGGRLRGGGQRDDVAAGNDGADLGAGGRRGGTARVEGVDQAVALDDPHLRVVAQPGDIGGVELGNEAVDTAAEDVGDVVVTALLGGGLHAGVRTVLEDHHVVLRRCGQRGGSEHAEAGKSGRKDGEEAERLDSWATTHGDDLGTDGCGALRGFREVHVVHP